MTERIWDVSVLDTTEGNFEISRPVPERYNLPLNPDGTKPKMTVKVTAPTLRMALSAAKTLRDDEDILVEEILSSALLRASDGDVVPVTEDFALFREALENDDFDEEDDSHAMQQFMTFVQQYTGWENTEIELTAELDNEEHNIVFDIRTPGYASAISFMKYVVSSEVSNSIIANAMPRLEDEEDDLYWDEDEDWAEED